MALRIRTENLLISLVRKKGPPLWEEAGNAASENASSNETANINSWSEHAPMPKTPLPFAAQLSDHDQQLTAAVSDVATPAVGSALQCPACKAQICQPQDLCFFSRGHEVHLILKPELPTMPPAFILAPIPEEGGNTVMAMCLWQPSRGHETSRPEQSCDDSVQICISNVIWAASARKKVEVVHFLLQTSPQQH